MTPGNLPLPTPGASLVEGREEQKLRDLLAETYTPEGVELWLAHAKKQGWSMAEKLNRARAMAEGIFS